MEHLTVKAVTTATDLGQFTAIAAVFGNVDRDGDRIVKGAFAASIEAWRSTGRNVPLHWNHSPDPDDIVGHIDPGSMVETDQGLVVEGQLALEDSERARSAWRAMRTGSIGLSFGYLTQEQRKAADGANELLALDLFEISLTPGPANASTRVLGMKSAGVPTDAELRREWEELKPTLPAPRLTVTELREKSQRLCAEIAIQDIPRAEPKAVLPTAAEQRREWDRLRFELAVGDLDLEAIKAAREPERSVPSMDDLRDQAKALGIPVPPPRQGSRERFRDDMLNLLSSR